MQGKILIVDAIATNRIVLKVKLKSAYYAVQQAACRTDALAMVRADPPDLVICAADLPEGGAAGLCAALAGEPGCESLPIIAIDNQANAATRIALLKAGARDVLARPLDETLLLGRVRSLIRAYATEAEWRMREDTCRALGLAEPSVGFEAQSHCALINPGTAGLHGVAGALRGALRCKLSLITPANVMQSVAEGRVADVFVLFLSPDAREAARERRLISSLRAAPQARHAGVIVVQETYDPAVGADALDLGADDLMCHGFDAEELSLRIRAVLQRKRRGEHMRASVRSGLEAAVFDPLTGLYNRRYAMPHLSRVAAHFAKTGREFAVMAADLDHFKRINDAYGHASGDAVLKEVASRLRSQLRSSDMVARTGGEEFLLILPGITRDAAQDLALRILGVIAAEPFVVPGSKTPIDVTISVGMAVSDAQAARAEDADEIGRTLLEQADMALYAAKGTGRNRVKLGRPAA